MPYAPTVNDRSGEILGNAQANAAQIRAQGMMAMGEGIGDGLAAIGSGLSQGMTKSQENRIASDGANAKFDMLKDYKLTDGQPLFSQETIDKFDTMPLGKRQGIVSTAESFMDHDLKRWMYQTQYNAQANRVNANMLAQQPAANQVPMSPSANPAQATNPAPAPAPAAPYTFNPQIKTSPATPAR
jgi:hypothetical protein